MRRESRDRRANQAGAANHQRLRPARRLPRMAGKIIFTALRLLLGAVFLAAGVLKVWDFSHRQWATPAFYEDITNYHIDETVPVKFALEHVPALTAARLSDATKL